MAEGFSAGHQYFENIRHENRDAFTMHYEDGKPAGNIFTHCWYTWKATSKKTGEELSIRGYAWMKWKDDKVETVYNAFDPTMYKGIKISESNKKSVIFCNAVVSYQHRGTKSDNSNLFRKQNQIQIL